MSIKIKKMDTKEIYIQYTTEELTKLMITFLTLENGGEISQSTVTLLAELERRKKLEEI
jgi:hypothetical protein